MSWDVLEGLDGDSRFDKLLELTRLGFPTNADLWKQLFFYLFNFNISYDAVSVTVILIS